MVEEDYDYNIYMIKPPKRNKYDVYILIISILTLFLLILITKQSVVAIQRYTFYKQNQEQINKLKDEQEKIDEDDQPLEVVISSKTPQLTETGKENIENIYHSETKRVFLTFDDGPSPNTASILDILKKENIPATFFVLGNAVEIRPDLVKRAYKEGHYIANHSYSHEYSKVYASAENVLEEYNKCNSAVQKAIEVPDYNSHLFRFPGGLAGGKYANLKLQAKQLLNDNNIVNVDWNCLTGDAESRNPTEEKLMKELEETSNEKNSVVVLMHDAAAKTITVDTLPKVISYFREKGYEFKNFYEIIK